MGVKHGAAVDLPEVQALPAPSPGFVAVYAKDDHQVYGMTADGTEMLLSNAPFQTLAVQDEGNVYTADTRSLQFTGAGVSVVVPTPGQVRVEVPGYVLAQPAARIYKGSNQGIATGTTPLKINFSHAEYAQPASFFDEPGDALVIPQTGLYMISAFLKFETTGNLGWRTLYVQVNGTAIRYARNWVTDTASSLPTTVVRKLTLGDRITMAATQNSGANVPVIGGITATCFEIVYLGPA